MPAPSHMSASNPNLQLAWDATSLNALMKCPRYYQYAILEGWGGSKVDLEFGILVHRGVETYWRGRLAGLDKLESTLEAMRVVLEESGHYEHEKLDPSGNAVWVPWGGVYEDQWRCEGTEPYKNKKGNRAKCPYSHKGKWYPAPAPGTCGECGSAIHAERRWLPGDPAKNRLTAVRLVAWYCEDQPEGREHGMQPVAFPDGTPAVELPMRVPLPYKTKDGEAYMLAGYLDRVASLGSENFITDVKTTKKPITQGFFEGFSPNTQMDTYDLIAFLALPSLNIRGLVLDAAQTTVGGAAFGRSILHRTKGTREEFFHELPYWFAQAEQFASDNYWPMNRANCAICPFKRICSKDPSKREMYLAADFQKRPRWNPLEER